MSDSQTPLISVVVPFFDSERYLADCIEALLSQEGVESSYEVILINNRSTDGSASIVERYPDLIVLEEETPGAYAARNTGIRRSRAPLIAFTDADCVVTGNWLQAILKGMEDPTVAILLGSCFYPSSAALGLRMLGIYENSKIDYVIKKCAPAYHFGYANNMAVRASVFEENELFKEWRRAADTELVHRLGARHPELRSQYNSAMKITHMEFQQTRGRLRRMSLYTQTNAQVVTFQELGWGRRLGVLLQLLRNHRTYR